MIQEQKNSIVAAALAYMKAKNLSQAEMCRLSHINAGYLSPMLKGDFVSGNTTIEKRWFVQLAKACDFEYGKTYWQPVQTPQFVQIVGTLQEARKNCTTAVIIDESGFGKTYAVDRFCLKYPTDTFRVTVSGQHSLIDIIIELSEVMNLETSSLSLSFYRSYGFTKISRVRRIVNRIAELKMEGREPIIIIDEAENLKVPVLQMLKNLYDGVKGSSSIVLIGTDQLLTKLQKLKAKNVEGMPQFYRRFKAGIVRIMGGKNFEPFFAKFSITDKGLCRLLNQICDNYGELNDYLEPALKEADEKGVPLTEEFFRIKYNLPKTNKS